MSQLTSVIVAYVVIAVLLWGYAAILLAQRWRRR